MSVRTRFAPSPTGFVHVGSIRTALFAWLYARKYNGKFILRIEDTDKAREVEGSIGHIMESLRWLGIEWDEGPDVGGPHDPYIQSGRLELYARYAKQLVEAGFAYPDPYTPEELEAFRVKAEEEKRPFLFREHRPEHFEEWDGTQSLRFKVPEVKRYEWHDIIRGDLSAGVEALDDFILIKGDGYPTYNFSHVVDDIEMDITHVMRGEEFISSTPKFLSLYEALDKAPPHYATMPVILNEGGNKKLSKRDGAKDILEYRSEGYLPEALVNFLALLGWNPGTPQELFAVEELITQFELERIQKSGAQFDEDKLLHLNQQWMRGLSDEDYLLRGALSAPDEERLSKAVPLLKERASTFAEARAMLQGELSCLFTRPQLLPELLLKNEPASEAGLTVSALSECTRIIETLPEKADIETIKVSLMVVADRQAEKGKEFGGRGAILWPLRYALSGLERSPDPFTLLYILGKEESLLRVDAALAILGK